MVAKEWWHVVLLVLGILWWTGRDLVVGVRPVAPVAVCLWQSPRVDVEEWRDT